MGLYREQRRALAFIARRGAAPFAELRARVAGYLAAFEAAVAPVPAALARRRPAPERWSIQEVVDHLLLSDRPAVDQLRDLLAGRSPPTPVPAGLISDDPHATPWPAARDALAAVHADFLAVLDQGADERENDALAPVALVVKARREDGTVAPIEWVERYPWKPFSLLLGLHTREHQDQVERNLAALAAAD